jgi:RHS repeat-associated protein
MVLNETTPVTATQEKHASPVFSGFSFTESASSLTVTVTVAQAEPLTRDRAEEDLGQDLSQSLQGAGGIGGLLCVVRNGEKYFPCFDGNGNISDYVDETGAVVAHREYDPFGRTVASSGPMKDEFHFWFSTKYEEPWWGLYYYGLRFYFPEISRWLSRDPIGEQGGLNLYAYVGNSCIHNIDPIGQRSWTRENYAGPALLNNNRMDFIIWIKHNFPDDRPLASAQWWQLFTIKWEYVLAGPDDVYGFPVEGQATLGDVLPLSPEYTQVFDQHRSISFHEQMDFCYYSDTRVFNVGFSPPGYPTAGLPPETHAEAASEAKAQAFLGAMASLGTYKMTYFYLKKENCPCINRIKFDALRIPDGELLIEEGVGWWASEAMASWLPGASTPTLAPPGPFLP